jgi:RNA polymerase sigma-70 factor, ECF subfamily
MTTALDDPDRWRSIDAALHGFFHTKVADPQARADLVQDVLLRMHERRDQLRDEDRLEAWAFRVARNALVDHYRRRHPSEELAELAEPEPEPTNRSGEILGAWLRTRIEQLPESYREVLELTEVRGLSQREAADTLGVPYSTLKSRVQRSRLVARGAARLLCRRARCAWARDGVIARPPRWGTSAGSDLRSGRATASPGLRSVPRLRWPRPPPSRARIG